MAKNITIGKNQKTLIYLGAAVVGVIIICWLFSAYLSKRSKNIYNKIRLEELRFKKNLAIQKEKDTIARDYELSQEFLEFMSLDEETIKSALLQEIEKIAHSVDASITNLSPQNRAEESADFKTYKADLRMEITFNQLIGFFQAVQKSKLLIKFDKFAITPKDDKAELLKLEGVVDITVLRNI
ncbi:MAG: hypothetical protein ABIG64_03210 [Candidatus Omnitrophota bacterium]